MVTASGETVDRIVGLEMGADDYLPKPVDLRELLARIKAVLRRLGDDGKAARTDDDREVIDFGRCRLDLGGHKMFDHEGVEITLTAMEFDLLKAFAERPNRVLSRDQCLSSLTIGIGNPLIDPSISESPEFVAKSNGTPESRKS